MIAMRFPGASGSHKVLERCNYGVMLAPYHHGVISGIGSSVRHGGIDMRGRESTRKTGVFHAPKWTDGFDEAGADAVGSRLEAVLASTQGQCTDMLTVPLDMLSVTQPAAPLTPHQ